MDAFRHSNAWYWRLARTAVEVLLGFSVANGANIMTGYGMDPYLITLVMAGVTAVCSPIIADLKGEDGNA